MPVLSSRSNTDSNDDTRELSVSIIIAAYDDWIALDAGLASIAREGDHTEAKIEVIVVDDGSHDAAPQAIERWAQCLALNIVRQPHAGISAARNRGIRMSSAPLLLFVDADCRLRPGCLTALLAAVGGNPQHDFFQLRLAGNTANVVGRAEELRLLTFQEHTLQPDGRIRYLNTAGFAIRRSRTGPESGLFDEGVSRGEDTLLLAKLMAEGELPRFVPEAVVEHDIALSLWQCLLKDVRSAYLEGRAYQRIASKGLQVRVTNRERLRLLSSMWVTASRHSLGASAWLVLVMRQGLQRAITSVYRHPAGC